MLIELVNDCRIDGERLTQRRYHARRDGMLDESSEIVDKPADGNRLISQSPGRCLRHNSVTNRSYSDHVAKIRHDHYNSNSNLGLLGIRKPKATDNHAANKKESQACHVKGSTANMREKKPTNDTADNVTGRKGNIEIERLDFGETGRLQKRDGVGNQRVSTEDLGCPNNTVLRHGRNC